MPAGAKQVEATTVDPTGQYIGGHAVVGQNFVPILWVDGVPHVLPVPAESAGVDAINEHGVVVGVADNGRDEWAFRYQSGKVTPLDLPVGYPRLYPAPAINSAGDVVMNAEAADSVEGANSIS